jgi:hypothetical protein
MENKPEFKKMKATASIGNNGIGQYGLLDNLNEVIQFEYLSHITMRTLILHCFIS